MNKEIESDEPIGLIKHFLQVSSSPRRHAKTRERSANISHRKGPSLQANRSGFLRVRASACSQTASYISSQVLSPWLGNKVDSGIGLPYRPTRLHMLAGRHDNTMPTGSTISPSQGLRIRLQGRKMAFLYLHSSVIAALWVPALLPINN